MKRLSVGPQFQHLCCGRRHIDGHELSLPSWREWSTRDPLTERAMEQMVWGVHPALRAFLGGTATSGHCARHQQEWLRTVCVRYRGQIGRADEPRTERPLLGRAVPRRRAFGGHLVVGRRGR